MNDSISYHERFLQYRLDELELSVRTANSLQNLGLVYVIDLVRKSEAELLATKTLNRASMDELKSYLAEMGLALGLQIG